MTRKLSDRELNIKTSRCFNEYPTQSTDGWCDFEEAKKSTFKQGDLIISETSNGPRKALVLWVSKIKSEYSDDWIQLYKVRLAKKDGTLGMSYRWIYPEEIRRGFEEVKSLSDKEHLSSPRM